MTRRLVWVLMVAVLAVSAAGAAPWRLDHVIVTMWSPPPPTEENLARLAAEQFTMTWVPESALDVAARHGLRAMLHDGLLNPKVLDDPTRKPQLDALVDRVKVHPALFAYYIVDEPSAADFPALGRLVAYLRERDPAHLAYINLFPTYASNEQLGTTGDTVTAYREHLRRFVAEVRPGLISWDNYPFGKRGDSPEYFLNLELVRDAARQAGVPFLNIIQASSVIPSWRWPLTPGELRYFVYTTLAYGGRGISYFLYWGNGTHQGVYFKGSRTGIQPTVVQLNREMAALSPELMALDSLGVYHAGRVPWGGRPVPADCPVQIGPPGEVVVGLFGSRGRATAFMVASRNYRQVTNALVAYPAERGGLEEFDREEARWRPVTLEPWRDSSMQGRRYPGERAMRRVVVPLPAGDGRLFRWAQDPGRPWPESAEFAADNDLIARLPVEWAFRPDPEGQGEAAGWQDPQADLAGWGRIRTDRAWYEQPGQEKLTKAAWARTTFTLPARFAGRPVRLWAGMLDEGGTVWVNGRQVLRRDPGARGVVWNAPFTADLTAAVRPGENTLVIRAEAEGGLGGLSKGAAVYSPK